MFWHLGLIKFNLCNTLLWNEEQDKLKYIYMDKIGAIANNMIKVEERINKNAIKVCKFKQRGV